MTHSTPAPGRRASDPTGGTPADAPAATRRVGPAEVRRALSLIDGSMVLMPFIPLVIAVTTLADIGWNPTASLATIAFAVAIVLSLPAFIASIRAAGTNDGAGTGRLGIRFGARRMHLALAVCGIALSIAAAAITVLLLRTEHSETQRLAFVPVVSVIMLLAPRIAARSALLLSAGLPAAVSLALSWLHGAGVLGGSGGSADPDGGLTSLALAAVLAGVGVVLWLSLWPVIWLRRVLTDLDIARGTESRLAVAEERLRFSRDLHDVLGRRMSQIAVQSELIAVLAEREAGADSRAAESARTVRHVAVESLDEIRALVRGYRSIDVRTELAGARRLLESAAIEVEVVGDPDVMPVHLHETAAWVVREAVTNILRHSQARAATITFTPDTLEIRDTAMDRGAAVDHDAAAERGAVVGSAAVGRVHSTAGDSAPVADGTGLTGLRERVAAVGGRLRTARTTDGFRLVVDFGQAGSAPGAPATGAGADVTPPAGPVAPDAPAPAPAPAQPAAPDAPPSAPRAPDASAPPASAPAHPPAPEDRT